MARVRNEQRPRYGYYVDHVIDIVGTLCLLGGLALSPYMSPVVALLLLVAYLMLSAEAYLATHARGIFRISLLGFGPTELRILLGAGTLCLYAKPVVTIFGDRLLLLDVAGVVAVVGDVHGAGRDRRPQRPGSVSGRAAALSQPAIAGPSHRDR